MRRGTFTDTPVSYAAVGATQNADLMTYPPSGYRPFEYAVRLGSGPERFAAATTELMTWGVYENSGVRVSDTEPGTGEHYVGVQFDAEGHPIAPANRPHEAMFTDDGTPYAAAGMTLTLRRRAGLFERTSSVRVVYVIGTAVTAGFAVGSLEDAVFEGEELYRVDLRDDGTVWAVVRGFHRIHRRVYRPLSGLLLARKRRQLEHRIRALTLVRA